MHLHGFSCVRACVPVRVRAFRQISRSLGCVSVVHLCAKWKSREKIVVHRGETLSGLG